MPGPVPLARGRHGAVVAPHHLATAAGLAVLRAGGHAVDAAIATNAVLAVVEPNHCGLGGDAFWLIWDAGARRQAALNGSGRAASGMSSVTLQARGHASMPMRGPLAITIPGAVRSWADAHRRFGRLPRDQVLAPAIDLAEGGFPAWDGFIAAVERTTPIVAVSMEPALAAGFASTFRPAGRAWRPGQLVRLPALASTLRRLAAEGFDAFYDGDLGERQAAFLAEAGLPVTAGDVAGHASTWGEPISTTYRGVRVTTHPPNSSGVVALELLNILEHFDPPTDVGDTSWIHLGVEAAKLAMADRDASLGDPEAREVPVGWLLDKGHARELAERIDPTRAASAPAATNPVGGGTVYLATVDDDGNAVSLIESNYSGFGSGVVDPLTGIHYQNRGSYFSLKPGHPNELAPGRRTLHTLMPAMLFRDGEDGAAAPWVIAGSMGGDAQPQIHAQLVSSLVDGGLDLATAIGNPRWFVEPEVHFAPPLLVRAEPRFRAGVLGGLEALGHPVATTEPYDALLGHEHAIELVAGGPGSSEGSVAAVTDPRSAGLPATW